MSVQGVPTPAGRCGRDANERRVWRCDGCGHHGHWGEGWHWLGALEDRKTGLPDIDRVLCPDCPFDPDIPVLPG